MSENKKLAIFESAASLTSLLAIISCAFPAYFEEGKADQSIFHMAGVNGVLFIGIALLAIALGTSIYLSVTLFLNKIKPNMTMILAAAAGVAVIVGGIFLAFSLFVCGYDRLNSELGFTQGAWGIRAGTVLVPSFALLTLILSYPAALIVLHHKDLEDAGKKAPEAKDK